MALSISNFASLKLPHSTLILGDMFELGAHSASEHAHIIKLTEQFGFEQVIFTGRQFFQFRSGSSYHFFEHVEDLTRYLSEHPIDNGNILIKGSRGMQLEKLVAYL
jgi:UDP-N-acetylmuramoyl-tripeptide--D-alanyl-D-alanine ligase